MKANLNLSTHVEHLEYTYLHSKLVHNYKVFNISPCKSSLSYTPHYSPFSSLNRVPSPHTLLITFALTCQIRPLIHAHTLYILPAPHADISHEPRRYPRLLRRLFRCDLYLSRARACLASLKFCGVCTRIYTPYYTRPHSVP